MKINAMLGKRMSLEEIAEKLNAEKVPTIHGTNRWTAASVRKKFVSQTRLSHAIAARRRDAIAAWRARRTSDRGGSAAGHLRAVDAAHGPRQERRAEPGCDRERQPHVEVLP